MHICYLSHEYPLWGTGGIGSFIQTIGRGLVAQGHKVSVVGIGNNPYLEELNDEGVEIYRLPASRYLRKGRFIENRWRIRKKLRELHGEMSIDIVESPEGLLFMLPKRTPYKRVIRMHGGHHFFAKSESRQVNRWKAFQEKRSFKNADCLVAVSKYVAEETTKLLNLKKPYDVIYNFVDFKKFDRTNRREVVKGQLLFVGTVCEKKGVGKLIESLPSIIEVFPHVKLKLIGRDLISRFTGESYTKKMIELMPDSIRPHVEFPGSIPHDQVPGWVSESEIVVLPSFMEAMPIAWLEVLAMGKPLVASQEGPGSEAVKDGVSGLLCDPYNSRDIAEKVIFFLSNPNDAIKMGENAHQLAQDNFNFEKLVEENIKFYSKICKSR